jgi:myo-inositol-1(or 4)-monophosphatase
VFATGVPFGLKKTMPETLGDLARLMPLCAGMRRWGAASLDLAYVAAGRFDGYWERELKAWDIAAGTLLVREAGGIVQPIRDGDDLLATGNIICGNDGLFEPFAKAIRNT